MSCFPNYYMPAYESRTRPASRVTHGGNAAAFSPWPPVECPPDERENFDHTILIDELMATIDPWNPAPDTFSDSVPVAFQTALPPATWYGEYAHTATSSTHGDNAVPSGRYEFPPDGQGTSADFDHMTLIDELTATIDPCGPIPDTFSNSVPSAFQTAWSGEYARVSSATGLQAAQNARQGWPLPVFAHSHVAAYGTVSHQSPTAWSGEYVHASSSTGLQAAQNARQGWPLPVFAHSHVAAYGTVSHQSPTAWSGEYVNASSAANYDVRQNRLSTDNLIVAVGSGGLFDLALSEETRFDCSTCNTKFASKKNIKRHLDSKKHLRVKRIQESAEIQKKCSMYRQENNIQG